MVNARLSLQLRVFFSGNARGDVTHAQRRVATACGCDANAVATHRCSMVIGRWSMVDGRWSMVDGRWSMVAGRWSMVAGRWSVVDGRPSDGVCFPLRTLAPDGCTANHAATGCHAATAPATPSACGCVATSRRRRGRRADRDLHCQRLRPSACGCGARLRCPPAADACGAPHLR